MEDETEGGGEGGMEDERPAPSEEVAALEGSRGGQQGRVSAGGEASFTGGEAGEAAEKAQDSQQEKRKEVFGLVKLQQEQLAKMDKQNSALRDTNEDLARQVMLAEHQAEQRGVEDLLRNHVHHAEQNAGKDNRQPVASFASEAGHD